VPRLEKSRRSDYLSFETALNLTCETSMNKLDLFLILGTIAIFTVGIFWSHFEAEARQVRRKYGKE
jgi:hypothetical protein